MSESSHDPGGRRTAGLAPVAVNKYRLGQTATFLNKNDWVIVEEPLELKIAGETLAITMRTPGHDRELGLGFLVSEGLVTSAAEVLAVQHCRNAPDAPDNVLDILPSAGSKLDQSVVEARPFVSSSACGLCGRDKLSDLLARLGPLPSSPPWHANHIVGATARLRQYQHNYAKTGAGHAAGAFDRTGTPHCIREDVGRHNAVDKVVGRLLLDAALPAHDLGLVVSGRISFEIVQKAASAGFLVVVGVSAPTSLAVSTAQALGMMLVGFSREDSFNVYCGANLARDT